MGIIVISLIRGLFRGFFKEFFSLLGVVVGTFIGIRYNHNIASILPINHSIASQVAAFLIAFLAFAILGSIIGSILKKFFKIIALGFIDRILGILFGTLEGIIIASIVAFAMSKAPLFRDYILSDGPLTRALLKLAHAIINLVT